MTDLATVEPNGLSPVQQQAILEHLHLNPQSVDTQALLLICGRYNLDPLLKHVVLISGRPYVTRDGYLAVAHRSGVLDGLEIVAQGEDDDYWWAKVSVFRKDMTHPFTYTGRYPKADAKHMKKYGPEMAVKCAEVMALRRAFNVTGIAAADEQWEDHARPPEPSYDWETLGWDDQEHYDAAYAEVAGQTRLLTEDQQAVLKEWLSTFEKPYSHDVVDEWDAQATEFSKINAGLNDPGLNDPGLNDPPPTLDLGSVRDASDYDPDGKL